MKKLIDAFRTWRNWRALRQAECVKRQAFFDAHRAKPDANEPHWTKVHPDNPGVTYSRIRHVHDVALPKTA